MSCLVNTSFSSPLAERRCALPNLYAEQGLVFWNKDLICEFMNLAAKNIFDIESDPRTFTIGSFLGQKNGVNIFQLPQAGTNISKLLHLAGKTGPKYINISLKALKTDEGLFAGYLGTCQNITQSHMNTRFNDQLIRLLKDIALQSPENEIRKTIYSLARCMGFSGLTMGLFDKSKSALSIKYQNTVYRSQFSTPPTSLLISAWMSALTSILHVTQGNVPAYFLLRSLPTPMGSMIHLPTLLFMAQKGRYIGFAAVSGDKTISIHENLQDPKSLGSVFQTALMAYFSPIFLGTAQGTAEDVKKLLQSKLRSYTLSDKQILILDMVLSGKTNKEIADLIHLSEQAVKYHLTKLFQKFCSKNRNQLRLQINDIIQCLH